MPASSQNDVAPISITAAAAPASLQQAARRVIERCDELARCSDRPGEITRLFCSPAMQAAHEKIRDWMAGAGLKCRLDAAGNLIGRLDSAASASSNSHSRPALVVGSHLDSVVNAGRYDGVLGVMIGLALAEMLSQAQQQLPFAIDVIGFSEEEGVRYQTPYIGSRGLIGDLSAELLERRDTEGVLLSDALRAFGGDPGRLAEAVYEPQQVVAFIEPHIEQGPVLELEGLPVGIVTGIAGQTRASFQFTGQAGHAGTVPMAARRDALAAAARFICEVEKIGRSRAGLVATVGHLVVSPNVSNVIPGEVHLRLDVRHLDDDERDAAFREMTHAAAVIAEEREIEFDWAQVQHQPAVQCDSGCVQWLEQAVAGTGLRPFRLPSGAGHDAVVMAKRFRTAMLFLRCAGGVSHHPDESVTEADVAAALEVLWRFVMKIAAAHEPRIENFEL